MAREGRVFAGGRSIAGLLSDKEWITVIGALLKDRSAESRRLAQKLVAGTKHGRHVRLLRLMRKRSPTIRDMQRATKASRRTIFRDLNSLEEYGVRFRLNERFGYQIERLPDCCKRLA